MFTTSLARASKRRVLLAGIAAAAASAGLTAAAPDAQAAFTLKACEGASGVSGQGASFQAGAQTFWRGVFSGSNGCGGTPAAPTYTANGSGNGVAAMGGGAGNGSQIGGGASSVRSTVTRFGATDDPPSTAQQATMNAGGSSASDDGQVHVIPVATGSSPVILHAPEGCDLSTVVNKTNGADGALGGSTTDSSSDKSQRIRIPNVLLERAFAGESDANTWGEIADGISGTATGTATDSSNAGKLCSDVPVKRIVRFDNSGTTFSFKAYLNLINPSRGWLTTYVTPNNLSWPTNGSGTTTPQTTGGPAPQSAFCPNTAPALLCAGKNSGNNELGLAVNATDGSIGYSDLAVARTRGFEIIPTTPTNTTQDYTFWIPLQNNPSPNPAAPTGYSEPTLDPAAHKVGNTSRGANCQNVAVQNVPTPESSPNGDPTLGDWSRAFAAGGPVYGACVLTYVLAWDDNAAVYGNSATEEARARTVKDFLTTIVGSFGQQVAAADYSALPNPQQQPLLTYAQNGVNAIGWNKTAVATQPPVVAPPVTPAAPQVTRPPAIVPPVVVAPSNAFTVGTGKVNARRTSMVFSVRFPGAGRLVAVASFKNGRRTVRMGTVTVNPTGAGTARVRVKLSSAARRLLKAKRRLGVSVRFTYTPTGGQARTITKASTVRPAATIRR